MYGNGSTDALCLGIELKIMRGDQGYMNRDIDEGKIEVSGMQGESWYSLMCGRNKRTDNNYTVSP